MFVSEVTFEEYASSAQRLFDLAYSDDSRSAEVAAQFLLSVHNGYKWHANLSEAYLLDSENLKAALTVVAGRVVVGEYVSTMIENGTALFAQLEKKWVSLEIESRYI